MQTIRDARDRDALATIRKLNVVARRRYGLIEFGRVDSYNTVEQKAMMMRNQADMDSEILRAFHDLSAAQVRELPLVDAATYSASYSPVPAAIRRVPAYPDAELPDDDLPIAPSAAAGIAPSATNRLSSMRMRNMGRLAGATPFVGSTGPGSRFDDIEKQIADLKKNGLSGRDAALDSVQRFTGTTQVPRQDLSYLSPGERRRINSIQDQGDAYVDAYGDEFSPKAFKPSTGNYPNNDPAQAGERALYYAAKRGGAAKVAAPLALLAVTVAASVLGAMSF